ncbi:MAG: hypothetical protein H6559_27675 [Lewinellaceae bacterium]|nr:hypothetical protein [Lewinellaceae bacterium]
MKHHFPIFFFLLLSISCSTPKKVVKANEQFLECIPIEFREALALLNESFEQFLLTNKEEKNLIQFVGSFSRLELPARENFDQKHEALFRHLQESSFESNIWSVKKEMGVEIELSQDEEQRKKEEENLRIRIRDIDKPYLRCLGSIKEKDMAVSAYLHTLNNSYGPDAPQDIIAEEILKKIKPNRYDEKILHTIIGVELYYSLLKAIYGRSGNRS